MIYLDHAAATPLSEKAYKAMQDFWSKKFFNPSAAYLPAIEVRKEYEAAKDCIAHTIGAKGVDLVITAGATESINLAFSTVNDTKAEVLISAVEHPSVYQTAQRFCNLKVIDVDKNGRINLDDLRQKLTDKTQFISICLASSELGTLQPLADVGRVVKEERKRRLLEGNNTPLYFHTDASQGFGVLEVKVNRLGVDLLTLNSGKIYGPKGMGALYVGHNVKIQPFIRGGGQERGLRSGTENVPAVIGFAKAAEEAEKHLHSEHKRLKNLKQILKRELADIENIKFLGQDKNQLANFLPISVAGVDAERIIFLLEDKELYLSTGAACAANKRTISRTLQAIGLSDDEINGSLRLSLGKLNNEENIKTAAKYIKEAIQSERTRLA